MNRNFNRINCPISTEILQSRIIERDMGWSAGVRKVRNNDFEPMCFFGNIVSLKIWNILPVGECSLDGHYEIYFHKDTLDFDLWEIGSFGNLISYIPNYEPVLVTGEDKQIVESMIADCVLWDRNSNSCCGYNFQTPFLDIYEDRILRSQVLLARIINS